MTAHTSLRPHSTGGGAGVKSKKHNMKIHGIEFEKQSMKAQGIEFEKQSIRELNLQVRVTIPKGGLEKSGRVQGGH